MRSTIRRHLLAASLATLAQVAMPLQAQAQAQAQAPKSYPSKPIKVIVPYAAGGVTDAVARVLMQKLGEQMQVPVIIENKGGANGQIGSAAVAHAAPDGYTLLATVAAHAINPSLYPNMTYALTDLRGVSKFGTLPLLLVSSAAVPPKDLKEFVAWAKANPEKATYASSGVGSNAHLMTAQFAQVANISLKHIPYKGASLALPDLFSGQVALLMDAVQTTKQQVDAGKLRALAMTSAQRWPSAPEVPTMAELGYPSMTGGSWVGLLAPAKTPDHVVRKLSVELQRLIDSPEIRSRLIELGIGPEGGTPEQFDAFIQSEAKRYADVIKKANIRVE